MTESEYDPEIGASILINDTDLPDEVIEGVVRDQLGGGVISGRDLAVLTRWSSNAQGQARRNKSAFDRDRYVNPVSIFDQFRTAADAVKNDDVVSGVIETTEQLAFKRVAVESEDKDEEYVWNQVVDELDLATRMREIWRELFAISQCYVASVWGRKDFKVGGKTDQGNKKKKTYNKLLVPTGLTLLDPLKVVPVGNFMFGQEKLVYIADRAESLQIEETLAGPNTSDLIVNQLLLRKYEPSKAEAAQIMEVTGESITTMGFFELNPDRVWRITATRPAYQRFADVRMASVFELLDLKHLLREMDRAHIVGSTNFIILVKKGSDNLPAKPQEIAELNQQMKISSRVPVIVGDHRIEIQIITPKMDHTLQPERYNALDSRITSRLYQILNTGNYASGTSTDDSMKLLKVVAASMEARRDNIRDSIMDHLFDQMYERNDELKEKPKMLFYPRRVALDFDPNIATYMQDLRDRGDISRETILAELDISEAEEAAKRKRESEIYDEWFTATNVPFSTPVGPDGQPVDSMVAGNTAKPGVGTTGAGPNKAAGRAGGGKTGGGGANRQSGKSGPPRGPAKS